MSKTYTREEIAAKVRALQAKAGRGATEAETAAAVAKAQELMLKYNLDQATIDGLLEKRSIRADIQTIERFNAKTYPLWKASIGRAVAYAFGCEFVSETEGYANEKWNGRSKNWDTIWITSAWNFRLIGTDENRQIAAMMYTYLAQAVERLADEGLPIAQAEFKAAIKAGARIMYDEWELHRFQARFPDEKFVVEVGHGKAWKHSFRLGAAERLSERLREQRKASEQGKTRAQYHREREAAQAERRKEARSAWDVSLDDLISRITDNETADAWEALAAQFRHLNINQGWSALMEAAREAGLEIPYGVTAPEETQQYALAVVGMFTELETANRAIYAKTYGTDEERKERKMKFQHHKQTGANSSSGYKAGQSAGSKIGLNKQLGG